MLMRMLSVWGQQVGVHHRTGWKWFEKGALPVNARQTETGRILVEVPPAFIGAGRLSAAGSVRWSLAGEAA